MLSYLHLALTFHVSAPILSVTDIPVGNIQGCFSNDVVVFCVQFAISSNVLSRGKQTLPVYCHRLPLYLVATFWTSAQYLICSTLVFPQERTGGTETEIARSRAEDSRRRGEPAGEGGGTGATVGGVCPGVGGETETRRTAAPRHHAKGGECF